MVPVLPEAGQPVPAQSRVPVPLPHEAELPVLVPLPALIEARMLEATHPDLTPHQRAELELDIAHLQGQLEVHARSFAEMDLEPGRGFVAAEGRNVGIPTPFNDAVVAAFHAHGVGQLKPDPRNLESLVRLLA